MDFITERIAIGDALDAEDLPGLARKGFRSVISLNGQLEGVTASQFGLAAVLTFTLGDGWLVDRVEFAQAVKALERFSMRYPPVLIHCSEGRSRSVMVVAAHLMKSRNLSFDDTVELIRAERPDILATATLRADWRVDDQWPVRLRN